ncbi:MAG TPA: GNAT family N-acetyltransferase [Fibrobacteria bacterium]|nr:GNAT family N-acetyltransferase [Fibrobacteria bacterium]
MITVRETAEPAAAEARLAEADALGKRAGYPMPYHDPRLALAWWRHFHGLDGADFGPKRGKNFYGVRSRVTALRILWAEEDGKLLGVLPLALQDVKTAGETGDVRMLCFCGDSVMFAYHDIAADEARRAEVLEAFFAHLEPGLDRDYDILFLGYMPQRSANLPWLRARAEAWKRAGRIASLGPNRRRGGVYPWTLYPLQNLARKIAEKLPGLDPEKASRLADLAAGLAKATPGALFFPATRSSLERKARAVLEDLAGEAAVEEERRAAADLLAPMPIPYPHLDLPNTAEGFLERLSKDTRRYFTRYKRRFLEAGGSFEKVEAGKITAADVEEYLELHRMRWGEDSASLNSSEAWNFHRALSLDAAKAGRFTLFFARFEGKRIASHSCLDFHPRREGYYNGRDPAQEELRAGRLLYMETINDAMENGFTEYNMGYGGHDYKSSFAALEEHTFNLLLHSGKRAIDFARVFSGYESIVPEA